MSFWEGPHVLQSAAWGQLKGRFGWQPQPAAGGLLLFRRLPLGLTLAYVPRGPGLNWAEPAVARPALEALTAAARARRAVLLKIEPDQPDSPDLAQALTALGLRPSPQTVQPRRSLVLDLAGSEDEILARMKPKTRYNIRLAAKKDVTVRAAQSPADVDAFNALMQVTGVRDQFGVHAPAYYQAAFELFAPAGQAALFLAEWQGEPLAGVMVFHLGPRAWYLYGASSDRERPRMAPYLAQWEAIRWARAGGARWYDLWGVPDEDEATLESQFEQRGDGLWGVYRFKRGWGGQLVRSIGAWDQVLNPALYLAYRVYLRWRRPVLG